MIRTITAALLGFVLAAVPFAAAHAQVTVQQPATVVVPAPGSASPGTTVVTPGPSGTTVIVPPGSTVTVQPPAPTATVPVKPWCDGAYSAVGGTNFGHCPGFISK